MLLMKHIIKRREGVADYMNKKKYGILIGVMGVIIVLLAVVLVVLIKQKSNDSGADTDAKKTKTEESLIPEELVGEWMLGDNVEYLTIYADGTVYRYKKSNDISEEQKIIEGDVGKIKDYQITFTKTFDSTGAVDSYEYMEYIPEDSYTPMSQVYDVTIEGDSALIMRNVASEFSSGYTFIKQADEVIEKDASLTETESKYELAAYIDNDSVDIDISALQEEIQALDGVYSVTYVSADEIWDAYKEANNLTEEQIRNFEKDGNLWRNDAHFYVTYNKKNESDLIIQIENFSGIAYTKTDIPHYTGIYD